MRAMIIKDLEINDELDKKAMACMTGGAEIVNKFSRFQLTGIVIQDNQLMKKVDEIWIKVEEYVKATKYEPLVFG